MLNVFITVDTEIWPRLPDWKGTGFSSEMDRDIYGITPEGEFGICFQMDLLDQYGLKAVFFVESLFASAVGLNPLREIVQAIQNGGHEVQLHIHTEWLGKLTDNLLPGRTGKNMKDFSMEEQERLIARGIENLKACGVKTVSAFRAGNYGANFDTLRALFKNGILYDTSYNVCYLDLTCGMRTAQPLLQPMFIEGVYEFPVSFFQDWPGHRRHIQLCACSWRELQNSLLWAWRSGWHSVILVSHSFEMIKRPAHPAKQASVQSIVVRRFRQLCRFLGSNRDKFRTRLFSELDPKDIPLGLPAPVFQSGMHHTAWRFLEQAAGRIL